MSSLGVAVIQMNVVDDKQKNIESAKEYIKNACNNNIDMVILPEMFTCPYDTSNFPIYAEYENGQTYNEFSNISKEYNIYLVCGSIPEKDDEGKIFNTSYVFDRNGDMIGKHRKSHLFDVSLSDKKSFKESDSISFGNSITVFSTEFGIFGLCICYDFRFVELSRKMVDMGAKAIIVPGAFNMTTGPIHWEILFKSRAIDNQVYTIGCAPSRNSSASYISYGNSICVSPWGDTLNRMDEKEGYFICNLNFDYVDKIRNKLPLLKHRRLDLYN